MRFAYLIMAHNNIDQLMMLLRLLDSKNNDIYLHIDKKTKNVDGEKIAKCVSLSNMQIYREFSVKWAGISQTRCQIFLLEQAIKKHHDYYHLLSGADLPLHSNATIERFFADNEGKQFIHFESDGFCSKDNSKYYIFGHSKLAYWLMLLQKKIGINRKLYCGANWYSITHDLACDFIKHKEMMLKMVNHTISSDEYILQTFYKKVTVGNYVLYKNTINDYSSVSRCIDWKRGSPYVWQENDFYELVESGRMFARKFDERIDKKIIDMIVKYIKEESEGMIVTGEK